MTLSIRRATTVSAAHRLAALTGQTLTDAVEDAIEARLALVKSQRRDPALVAARVAEHLSWAGRVFADVEFASDDE